MSFECLSAEKALEDAGEWEKTGGRHDCDEMRKPAAQVLIFFVPPLFFLLHKIKDRGLGGTSAPVWF